MSLESESVMAADGGFRSRVKAAMARAATAIIGEPTSTAGHEERHALGVAILHPGGFERYVGTFARLCAANPTVAASPSPAEVTDNDLAFTVTAVWDDVAGVKATV